MVEVRGIENDAFQIEESQDSRYDEKHPTDKQPVMTKFKWKIIKNILIISLAFTFLFTSYNSLVNVQSSINKQLGTASLSSLYVALVMSCSFLPSIVMRKLQVKWTIVVSMFCYSFYMAAQFYPTYYTMVPTAILLGLGAGPLWSAKCTYLTLTGETYSEEVKEAPKIILTRFFGIFFLFFQMSQVIGNLISSTILSQGIQNITTSEERLAMCGRDFCPSFAQYLTQGDSEQSSKDDQYNKTLLSSICVGCALASAVIVALFVDPLSNFTEIHHINKKNRQSGLSLMLATFKHLTKPYQLLIIPLTIWSGLEQSFIGADFTQAFITCGIGVHMIGYVMICYGVFDSICSIGFSPLMKITGRVPIFIISFVMNLIVISMMYYWKPDPDNVVVFFVMAAMWGIADAVWQTQINAFYGVIFDGTCEAAFSNYKLWESLGFILGYSLSSTTCMTTKLCILLIVLFVGFLGYLIIEFMESRKIIVRMNN